MQNQAYSGAYISTRHPLGTFHRQSRQQSAEPGTDSESAPQLRSEGSVLIAAIPQPRGPRESTFLPLLLKWIRPLPANLNADRSIPIVPRGSRAHAHPEPGNRDHPPLRTAAPRRHGEGGGRRGDAGEGIGMRGRGCRGTFSRVRGSASRHRKSRTNHREEDLARKASSGPTNGTVA